MANKRPVDLVATLTETKNTAAGLSSTLKDTSSPDDASSTSPKRFCTSLRSGSFLARPEVFRIGPNIFMRTQLKFNTQNYEFWCESMVEKNINQALPISTWGLPNSLVKYYQDKGIEQLFQWQVKALCQPGVFTEGRNLVYSAPTSAGKSMVADMLMYKTFFEKKKKVIIILPFVSITHEKVDSLKKILQLTGITMECFAGNLNPPGGFSRADAAVCTIEKANNMINRLIEDDKLSDVGLVIVDELHMLADSGRGYLLELLLSKLLFATSSAESKAHSLQIVGMSATIPNLSAIASWLNAALFVTDFRPVPLTQLVVKGDQVFEVVGDPTKSTAEGCLKPVEQTVDIASLDISSSPDDAPLVYYAMETLSKGFSTLIFCPTKLGTEKLALIIAENIYDFGAKKKLQMSEQAEALGKACRENLCMKKINELYKALFGMPMGLDLSLGNTVRFGVGFHHAGMCHEERSLIERAFRDGTIKVLCSTTTLSAGVNLPARRVLINGPFDFSGAFLPVATYRQMIGRAGRAGIDTLGEAMLFCKEKDFLKAMKNLVSAPLPPIESCLAKKERPILSSSLSSSQLSDNLSQSSFIAASQMTLSQVASAAIQQVTEEKSTALKRAILEVVSNGTAKNEDELENYIKSSTFYSTSSQLLNRAKKEDEWLPTPILSPDNVDVTISSSQAKIQSSIIEALLDLTNEDLIHCGEEKENENNKKSFSASTLGKAIVASGIGPEEGLFIQRELNRARENRELENDQHIVYLVTPPYIARNLDLDWDRYLNIYDDLSEAQRLVGDIVGVSKGFIIGKMGSVVPENKRSSAEMEKFLVHQRFYASLALYDLVQEVPLKDVVERYNINKGHVQSMQQNAATFAGMLVVFCERMGPDWEKMRSTFREFQPRLAFGTHRPRPLL